MRDINHYLSLSNKGNNDGICRVEPPSGLQELFSYCLLEKSTLGHSFLLFLSWLNKYIVLFPHDFLRKRLNFDIKIKKLFFTVSLFIFWGALSISIY
jgi:hypothetical protein